MGITVHPVARSESESESIKSVVRSSRSSGYLKITTTTKTFSVMFSLYIIEVIFIHFEMIKAARSRLSNMCTSSVISIKHNFVSDLLKAT